LQKFEKLSRTALAIFPKEGQALIGSVGSSLGFLALLGSRFRDTDDSRLAKAERSGSESASNFRKDRL
jgi:hypothetical protein